MPASRRAVVPLDNAEPRKSSSPASHHGHLWKLPDGTGLHAPPEVLVVDPETGHLCCHLCGRWYRSLGAHVRVHGHTADTYREEMGLLRAQALTDDHLSAEISARQQQRYDDNTEIQRRFTEGRQLLPRGQGSRTSSGRTRQATAAAAARQAQARAAGTETKRLQRRARLDENVAAAGFADLSSMLQLRYAAGASLESLARETGLGRSSLQAALATAGVTLRARGQNTEAGRRSRAQTADLAAAQLVGTEDLVAWLRSRREKGWTLSQLGDAVGHSGHWVSWRLERPVGQMSTGGS